MKPGLCWLLGHSRGPVADRIETETSIGLGYVKINRFCGSCGKPADGFSLVRKHRLGFGDDIPRGYGVAWVSWSSPTAVLLPIPFNLIAGVLYRLRYWAKYPRNLVACPEDAYRQGHRDGHAKGMNDEIRARLRRGIHQNGPGD